MRFGMELLFVFVLPELPLDIFWTRAAAGRQQDFISGAAEIMSNWGEVLGCL